MREVYENIFEFRYGMLRNSLFHCGAHEILQPPRQTSSTYKVKIAVFMMEIMKIFLRVGSRYGT